jgi:two-component system sensor histidine kinase KdpD
MRTGRGGIGIVGTARDQLGLLLRGEQKRLLDALIDQGALAIERVHLVDDIERVKHAAETDRLRSALLTSISHDLKTPLATVLGAASVLRDLAQSLDERARSELLATIVEESEWLNRFIALLDMTRLDSGAVAPNAALHDVGEIIGSALERARKILAHHKFELRLSEELPMLFIDPVLLEEVLFNLLDNASKHALPGSAIRIHARRKADAVAIEMLDEGSGIPAGELERIFDKFYCVKKGDSALAGTGLGLAICRGFVEALHGTITAHNRSDGAGAAFVISLPVPPFGAKRETAA